MSMLLRISLFALLLSSLSAHAAAPLQREQVRVVDVFDGDTIVVDQQDKHVTIRLIGVDTPETSRPGKPVQFFGPEASEFTRTSLLEKEVWLEFEQPDWAGGRIDRYDRTLAYVVTAEGNNFNRELVRRGYGKVYALYPFTYQREFEQAERMARAEHLGIWDLKRRRAWSDPATRGRIIGNIRSHIYHLPGQDGYNKVFEKNRVYFATEEEALRAGFRGARSYNSTPRPPAQAWK